MPGSRDEDTATKALNELKKVSKEREESKIVTNNVLKIMK